MDEAKPILNKQAFHRGYDVINQLSYGGQARVRIVVFGEGESWKKAKKTQIENDNLIGVRPVLFALRA